MNSVTTLPINTTADGLCRPLKASTSSNGAANILNFKHWSEQGGAFKCTGAIEIIDE